MKKTFVVSDESLNRYGFRVLTAGIDIKQFKKNPIMLYMHERNLHRPTGDEVIGYWENIRVKGTQLLADAVFDETNKFAQKIAKKVKGGFIKMASIGIQKTEVSEDKKHLIAGQTRATVTRSILQEISIVDMGGNSNALKLYANNGQDYELDQLNLQAKPTENLKTDIDMSLKSVALALGLNAEANEAEVITAATKLKADKDSAETKLTVMQSEIQTAQKAERVALMAKAKKLEVLPENMEATYEALFDANHESTKLALQSLIDTNSNANTNGQEQLGNFVKNINQNSGSKKTPTGKECFDYLQKHDVAKLRYIKEHDPTTYTQLANDYGNGVRYSEQ